MHVQKEQTCRSRLQSRGALGTTWVFVCSPNSRKWLQNEVSSATRAAVSVTQEFFWLRVQFSVSVSQFSSELALEGEAFFSTHTYTHTQTLTHVYAHIHTHKLFPPPCYTFACTAEMRQLLTLICRCLSCTRRRLRLKLRENNTPTTLVCAHDTN